ncbi:malate dehydrogenase (quinone) [Falsarthrobacter nasiphocae]|uniref:Probable malate:quinone oxidoreductase n=1 Tax=Falsarthrobacter nasiphocae TaxID=189863 RepID=A0AAE4C729_9MICC|nr:malate:quinone oxidoreductase [Falsarthrobacter nasiphocae]MDR6892807.1 malate dehydrogenase (quinone) [Falsarthrobacter nasiphocae]
MSAEQPTEEFTDVLLLGAGIMSATLGTMLQEVDPNLQIRLIEMEDRPGTESSAPWNNAGTGHAALCELNYAPQNADGTVSTAKALAINEQFQVTRQYWSHLVRSGRLTDPSSFVNPIPHASFVWGDAHADYLRARYEAFSAEPLFRDMEHTEDPEVIRSWAPLIMEGRTPGTRLAMSRFKGGTDVDFGALTRKLVAALSERGGQVEYRVQAKDVTRNADGTWTVLVKHLDTNEERRIRARFVFVGAGGGALPLLQKSGIPEGKGFAGFPISGQFLRCTDESIVAQHAAKVYGQAQVGAPPMSVPHLDTRFVNGKRALMFGPFAGFSTKFLKGGSFLDLPLSLRPQNIVPMLAVAKDNVDLTKYLVTEVLKSQDSRIAALKDFAPAAQKGQWELITAGQRVQVIKKDPQKGGILQFGTELITSADGSLAALLGASPGASTAAPIMIELIRRCFGTDFPRYEERLREIIPSYGKKLNEHPDLLDEVTASTNEALGLTS